MTDSLCRKRKLADLFIPCDDADDVTVLVLDAFKYVFSYN